MIDDRPDSFDLYEKNFSDLVAVDSSGRYLTKTDFLAREKEEMRQLTKASPLSDNIWVRGLFRPHTRIRLDLSTHDLTSWIFSMFAAREHCRCASGLSTTRSL